MYVIQESFRPPELLQSLCNGLQLLSRFGQQAHSFQEVIP